MKSSSELPCALGNLLAIDTSSPVCSVALMVHNHIAVDSTHKEPNEHDSVLAGMVEEALDAAGLRVSDLYAIAISAGPGSFTGLRSGCAMAKALCYGDTPKLLSVGTLQARAAHASKEAGSLSTRVINRAQAGRYYMQEFDARAKATTQARLISDEELDLLNHSSIFVCGDALNNDTESADRLRVAEARFIIDAVVMGCFNEVSATDFVPLYVQDFKPKLKPADSANNITSRTK